MVLGKVLRLGLCLPSAAHLFDQWLLWVTKLYWRGGGGLVCVW